MFDYLDSGLDSAQRCTEALYSESADKLASLTEMELADLFKNAPTAELMLEPGMTVLDVVMKAQCFARISKIVRNVTMGFYYRYFILIQIYYYY